MHVQSPKFRRDEQSPFFRQDKGVSTANDEYVANNEPMDEPKHATAADKPVDENTGKSGKFLNKRYKNMKTRRGYGKKNIKKGIKRTSFSIMGSNSNGIMGKKESLFKNINHFQPTIITLQETKLRVQGLIKINGYQVFEKVRKGYGGGLLTAVDENLQPVLISTGKTDESEILVIQFRTQKHNIRVINAYGPQEDSTVNNNIIYEFWQDIEQEIISGKEENCLLSAKLGNNFIKNNPFWALFFSLLCHAYFYNNCY